MTSGRAALILLIVSFSFLAAGCLQSLNGGTSQYTEDYKDSLARVAMSAPNMTEECRIGSCWCMVCKNGTNLFGPMENLIAGSCYMDKNCTAQRIGDLSNSTLTPDLSVRQFMVGSGPTFGDFASANTYCSSRLGMAVQWLIATNETPYLKPDAMRSMCFLSKSVIPVYILYSNGTNINRSRSEEIGEVLGSGGRDVFNGLLSNGPVGPVVVVTEIDFEASRAGEVAAQVRAIDSTCNQGRANRTCFIAVAPKMNDFAALDAVMNALSADSDKVDLVAFGVNGKYVHGCNGEGIRLQAQNFSSYALYNHSKPSIIPYVMFDPGTSDADNSCNWTEDKVVSAYGSFFPFGVQTLQKRGVIGIAPYSYNTTGGIGVTNPLNCSDCAVGKTADRMRAWFGGCQAYTNVTRMGSSNPSGGTLIVFGNESGTICNQNTQMDFLAGFGFNNRDIMQRQAGSLNSPMPRLFSCDACLLSNASRSPTSYFPSLSVSPINNTLYCEGFPEMDQWASARNLDPMLVRAFALTESNFTPCSAAKVCNQGYEGSGCFEPGPGKDECYDKAYDEMYDPAGNCTFEIAAVVPGQNPDFRYCAVGIMQSLEPPYTFWPSWYHPEGISGPYFDVYQRSGFYSAPRDENDTRLPMLDMARSCNPSFNPFTPADSICVGTLKMESMLRAARAWIRSNGAKLNWNTGSGGDLDKTSLFAAYIAGNMYAGFWGMRVGGGHPRCPAGQRLGDCWADDFHESWLVNETYCQGPNGASDYRCENGVPRRNPPLDCYGYSDWMSFVEECEKPYLSRKADPGRNKVEAYLNLLSGCSSSMCPDGKRLLSEMCNPAYGDINPRYCLGPNQPRYGVSGTPYMPDSLTQGTSGTGGSGSSGGTGGSGNASGSGSYYYYPGGPNSTG